MSDRDGEDVPGHVRDPAAPNRPPGEPAETQPGKLPTENEPNVLDTTAAGGLIIRGGVLRFGSYVGVVGLSVLSAALLTRYLAPTGFSQYTTVLSLVGLIAIVTDAGMSNLAVREFSVGEGAERDALMRDLLGLRVALTTLGVVLVTAFAVAAGYSAALLGGTVVAGVATIALVLQHTLTIPLAAELRLGVLSLLELARQALTMIAIVALIVLGAGVFPLLAVTLVVYVVLIPVTARLAGGRISLRLELRPRRWRSLLRLTVAFSLATAVGAVYVYTAQIITSLVASGHQSGLFAASFRVFMVAVTVPGLLVSGAIPLLARAARDDRERLAYAMQRIFEVSLILGLAAALGMLAGAQFVIAVIAGPKYAGAAASLRILGVAMSASFLVAGWGFALLSLKRYTSVLVVNTAALIVSCALTLILASTHGAQGAALATLCGELTLAAGYLLVLVLGNPELRPRLQIVPKVALAAVPAVALALALELPSLVRAVLALAVYGLLIAWTRATPEEITALIPRPRWLPRG
jgi:O-antigen/teichoic acid export membrane protein